MDGKTDRESETGTATENKDKNKKGEKIKRMTKTGRRRQAQKEIKIKNKEVKTGEVYKQNLKNTDTEAETDIKTELATWGYRVAKTKKFKQKNRRREHRGKKIGKWGYRKADKEAEMGM